MYNIAQITMSFFIVLVKIKLVSEIGVEVHTDRGYSFVIESIITLILCRGGWTYVIVKSRTMSFQILQCMASQMFMKMSGTT